MDASVLALKDTILNEDIAVFKAQSDVRQEIGSIKESWVASLLDKQLPHLLTVSNNVLEVLQDDLDSLLVDIIGLGHDLNTSQALNPETGLLERALWVDSNLVQLLNRDTSRVEDVVVLWRQDDGDVGFATGQQSGVVVKGGSGVDEVKDGLDILVVDGQSNPVGEQGGTLRISFRLKMVFFISKSEYIVQIKQSKERRKDVITVLGVKGILPVLNTFLLMTMGLSW